MIQQQQQKHATYSFALQYWLQFKSSFETYTRHQILITNAWLYNATTTTIFKKKKGENNNNNQNNLQITIGLHSST
jgi:hypothetical protein